MGKVNYLVQYGEPNYKERGWLKCSNDAKVLVKGLLTKDPKKRLTAQQALKHKWLQRVDGKGNKMPRKYGIGKTPNNQCLVLSDSDEQQLDLNHGRVIQKDKQNIQLDPNFEYIPAKHIEIE